MELKGWYAVYSGSEKLDLGKKEPIAFVRHELIAKKLIEFFGNYGYYEQIN